MGEKKEGEGGAPSLGDMPLDEFRGAAHRVADEVIRYLEHLESYDVLPDLKPGEIRARLPEEPPSEPESLDAILGDYRELIEPNITHWQHPGFLAYFPSVASGPGILGEWLAAGLNSNVMFWQNAPASTELEERVVDWMRRLYGLPERFDGMFTDTASVSSLLAVVAARHAVPDLGATAKGLAGRPDVGPLRLYCSAEAHYSVDNAAMVVGAGRKNVCRIPVDAAYRMKPGALEEAITRDRKEGRVPFCVVSTLGTTSSTSLDPAEEISRICERQGVWHHVDAAYAGTAAIVPELRPLLAGWERADSIVVNPHKWMFTPFDASLLLFRRPEVFRAAFRRVPEYIRTGVETPVHNYNEYGVQMGRRFRALKVWMLIRYFGARGIADRIREHCRMARELAGWIEAEPGWELLAPVPLAVVCLRFRPPGEEGDPDEPETLRRLNRMNEEILRRVNRSGRIFLSHTKLGGRYAIRISIGNPRTTPGHVTTCWDLLREAAGVVSLDDSRTA